MYPPNYNAMYYLRELLLKEVINDNTVLGNLTAITSFRQKLTIA